MKSMELHRDTPAEYLTHNNRLVLNETSKKVVKLNLFLLVVIKDPTALFARGFTAISEFCLSSPFQQCHFGVKLEQVHIKWNFSHASAICHH